MWHVTWQVHGHVKTHHFAGCKDYWAAFLFILHFWAVVGVCIYLGLRGVIKTNHNNDLIHAHYLAPAPAPALPHHLYSIRNWAPQLGAAAGSGWIFALIWQSLLRMFPRTMIYVCLSMGAVATGNWHFMRLLSLAIYLHRHRYVQTRLTLLYSLLDSLAVKLMEMVLGSIMKFPLILDTWNLFICSSPW